MTKWQKAPLRLGISAGSIALGGIKAIGWLKNHLMDILKYGFMVYELGEKTRDVIHEIYFSEVPPQVMAAGIAATGATVVGFDMALYKQKEELRKTIFGEALDPSIIESKCDSGKHHESFRNEVHPANQMALQDLVKNSQPIFKRILARPINKLKEEFKGIEVHIKEILKLFSKFRDEILREAEKSIQEIPEKECVSVDNHILCIGSPKSTYYSRKLLGYTDEGAPEFKPEMIPFKLRYAYDFNPKDFKDRFIIQVLNGKLHITQYYVIRDEKKGKIYPEPESSDHVVEYGDVNNKRLRNFIRQHKNEIKTQIEKRYKTRIEDLNEQLLILQNDYLLITKIPNHLAEKYECEALIPGGLHGAGTWGFSYIIDNIDALNLINNKVEDYEFYQICLKIPVKYDLGKKPERWFTKPDVKRLKKIIEEKELVLLSGKIVAK